VRAFGWNLLSQAFNPLLRLIHFALGKRDSQSNGRLPPMGKFSVLLLLSALLVSLPTYAETPQSASAQKTMVLDGESGFDRSDEPPQSPSQTPKRHHFFQRLRESDGNYPEKSPYTSSSGAMMMNFTQWNSSSEYGF
jgi:hypothetical protein